MDLPAELPLRILDGSPDAVLVSDRDGKIAGWNAAAERIFGFAAAEVVGASMDLIIPERLRGRHWGGWDRVMETGVTRYGAGELLAVPALHKDGRQLSVEFSIQLLQDGAGRIGWVVAVFRDVTERFQRDKALKLRLRELEAKAGGAASSGREAAPDAAPQASNVVDPAALPPAQAVRLATLLEYAPGAVVSRVLAKASGGSVTLFAFEAGQELSEHTAPFDALVEVLDGEVELVIGGAPVLARVGETVRMPAGVPHAVKARTRFKMLLTMVRQPKPA